MSEPDRYDNIEESNMGENEAAGRTVEDTAAGVAVTDTHGLFSGSGTSAGLLDGQTYGGTYGAAGSAPYYGNGYPSGNVYNTGSAYPADSTYGTGSVYDGGNSYNTGSVYGGGSSYGAGNTYGGNSYGAGSTYGGNAYGGSAYPTGNTNTYGNAYGGSPYGAGQADGGYGNQPPYGGQPYGDNPFSPFAAPQKRPRTGLIVTVVLIIVFLAVVAVCALAHKLVTQIDEEGYRSELNRRLYHFTNDYEYHGDGHYHHDDYDYDDYDYNYDYDYYEEDDRYYSLHDDMRYDLSYSVEFEFYEYETDNEDVAIYVTYPVIEGEDVQNLEALNEAIYSEVTEITEFYEEEYAPHVEQNDENAFFSADCVGYVTYMDEDKLSIVFQESVYADSYMMAYLYCINIDMANGVILDNQDMLSINDDFSVEFRTRSDEQNGEIYAVTRMTDQEITGYFNSQDVIVFYTPKGMEIGFNYEDGWVTVTYEEYEQYLKVF